MSPQGRPAAGWSPATVARPSGELTALVYELLDAHLDTEQLMSAPSTHLQWLAHLHYLRDLQRSARELLARTTAR